MERVWARRYVHLIGDGEDGLESDTLLACNACLQGCQGSKRIVRTDETAHGIFTDLCTRANIAYCRDIVGRKAEFITLKHDEVFLNLKIQRRRDVICIFVVVGVLYKLKQKVRFFVVQVARKSVGA